MKKIALAAAVLTVFAGTASAADLAARPYTKAPPPVGAVYNWTGFYVGGNIGYGWGENTGAGYSSAVDVGIFGLLGFLAAGGNFCRG